ncbi:MAG: GspH/FimT family pseudopilin [Steroidobacteraceae bacterium]
MVALSVAALLMAIGIPTFREIIASNRLTEDANDMVAAMMFARSEAIKSNQGITFCRADSDGATTCSSATGSWPFWIVRNPAGAVLRRGELPNFGGNIVVKNTLTSNQVTFASDGLARTNNGLINGQTITVCSNHSLTNNQRLITLGAGSRIAVTRVSGVCP